MHRLNLAFEGLDDALTAPPRPPQSWAHAVGQRVHHLLEELDAERPEAADTEGWLLARAGHLDRERRRLLTRLAMLTSSLQDTADLGPEADRLRDALTRLSHDISHHRQRVHDLVWDGVSRDMGGSE